MSNRLAHETSPYLLQHKDNPVDWYPWGDGAFEKARCEEKTIFLSIGYSTCHWCHVMAHESFENPEIADLLNRYFVSVKVDREERPDIDSAYMTACQAMTGSGGWPTSLFLTAEGKPFFAGTYFPPKSRYGMIGFYDLLLTIAEKWENDRQQLLRAANQITNALKEKRSQQSGVNDAYLPQQAFDQFVRVYDSQNGGFGKAPKFPTPHNLLFLMLYGKQKNQRKAIDMAVHTLTQMRKGGIYDHIGGGFSRYSTDARFLIPHFEKMLYDNALLILAYCSAYKLTKNEVLLNTAEMTAEYVLREMTDSNGGFYSAQDADSEGGEGLYYVFDYEEILQVLGASTGRAFCSYFGVTPNGNFEGKNILHRLHGKIEKGEFQEELQRLYAYRKDRMHLHLDDKILTAWNSLMIAALAFLYRTNGNQKYLNEALRAERLIHEKLHDGSHLFVVMRDGKVSGKGFLDDYAFYSVSLLILYSTTGDEIYLNRAKDICREAIEQFWDASGGFTIAGKYHEKLILNEKESYDGAIPSGNAVMAYVLVRLSQLDTDGEWQEYVEKQRTFLAGEATEYPAGHSMFLLSLLTEQTPPPKIVAVCAGGEDIADILKDLPLDADIMVLTEPKKEYPLLNHRTTYYVCQGRACYPPTNEWMDFAAMIG